MDIVPVSLRGLGFLVVKWKQRREGGEDFTRGVQPAMEQ